MTSNTDEFVPLEYYGRNMTHFARLGAFSPLAGQEAVVSRVFHVFQRKNKNTPVIVGADENRRWAVVAEIVRRMAVGDAPDAFIGRQVIALDYEALFGNLSDDMVMRQERRRQMLLPLEEMFGQVKPGSDEEWTLLEELFRWPSLEGGVALSMVLERLQSIFVAMHQAAGSYVLFVDYFHRLVGGEGDDYCIDAVDLLKPALARGQIQLIGACTLEQYRRYFERDAAMQRRCQEICLLEAL